MSVRARSGERANSPDMMGLAKRVGVGGVIVGLLGGAAMIGLMILVMGTSGSGYASPLNLGIPAFVKTITPPASMLPNLIGLMGIHLPAAAMAQLGPAISSGHIPPAMAHQLGAMLLGMHVPPATVHTIGVLMSGHASNSTMANLLSGMSPSARSAVMSAMPVSTGHVAIGAITHFAYLYGSFVSRAPIELGCWACSAGARAYLGRRSPAVVVAT